MRLAPGIVDKRAYINFNRNIKTNEGSGIIEFGDNNDYPQLIEMLINGSKTAKSCVKIYSKFLTGLGFENEAINKIVVGTDHKGKKITVYDLLSSVCVELAKNNGAYIHLNFRLNQKVKNSKLVPFKYCRFSGSDDLGFSAKVLVCDNWTKSTEKTSIRKKSFDNSLIKEYNVFNSNTDVFISQVNASQGIEKYNGQIYCLFLDEEFIYPLSVFDSVYLDLDSESQISIFKNNILRNQFLDKTVVRIAATDEDTETEITNKIYELVGADGTNVLVLTDDIDPETGELKNTTNFIVDKLKSEVNPDLFEKIEQSTANNIRKVVNGMPAILIDYEEGKLSTTSGESIIQATNFFNAMTENDREKISLAFKEIFTMSDNEILSKNQNWKIKKLNLHATDIQSTTSNQANLSK